MRFDVQLDAAAAFEVTATAADGTARTIAGTGTVTVSGFEAVVALGGAVAYGETVTVAYDPAQAGSAPLRGTAGHHAAGFSGESVESRVVAAGTAAVTELALVSSSARGLADTYAAGETVRVRATFLRGGGGRHGGRHAAAQASTSTPRPGAVGGRRTRAAPARLALVFAWRVASDDASAEGIAVRANSVEANGGTVRSAAGADAALGHAGRAQDAGHKVDGVAPYGWAGRVSGTALTIPFSEALDPAFVPPAGAFTVRGHCRGDGRTIVATGTVEVDGSRVRMTLADSVHGDCDGYYAYYAKPDDAGRRLRDLAGNESAAFTWAWVENRTAAPEVLKTVSGPRSR